ncbi:hypothetical protein FIBSPDRAFT_760691 [Athelia psychrophila]|uniref:Uncharacterized protein n=1 Tax=Athelia psychrophila TaxID=1759441 RepID=A0A165XUL0_9AGAM|nr:hypothetical protein FIBSPDRAFT_760691 [Fibularhizoctonia sp. CBS 109695]
MSSTPPPPPKPSSRFAPYKDALQAISIRTRTPLPSLILSFGLMHELTAIVPLVGLFYGARTLGVGERVVQTIAATSEDETGWAMNKCQAWITDGEKWAGSVGRRYGFFGYEQGENPQDGREHRLAGDVANAVFAYGMTKALLPVRIGLSLYYAPLYSRTMVEPFRAQVMRLFKSRTP